MCVCVCVCMCVCVPVHSVIALVHGVWMMAHLLSQAYVRYCKLLVNERCVDVRLLLAPCPVVSTDFETLRPSSPSVLAVLGALQPLRSRMSVDLFSWCLRDL